jgi:GNAT superfamily N-acetyltransferase
MADEVQLVRVEEPTSEDSGVVREGLVRFNREVLGETRHWPVVFHLVDEDGGFVGGLSGDVWLGRLSIEFLWIEEGLRGRGLGRGLIESAERYGVECGATHAQLDTYDFQAGRAYYEGLGYEVFGTLGGSSTPTGHFAPDNATAEAGSPVSYFMWKDLRSS